MAVADIQRSKEFKNYVTCQVALSRAGEGLGHYTRVQLHAVHTRVAQTLANKALQPCNNQCSQQHSRYNTNR